MPESISRSPPAGRSSTRWILLVDDETAILQMVEAVLLSQGLAVKLADGAQAALALTSASPVPPVLMICDVIMPRTDGLTLARQMLARLPKLKILFISGHLADAAWWPADLSGIRLLAKPFTNAELILAVNEALAEASAVD